MSSLAPPSSSSNSNSTSSTSSSSSTKDAFEAALKSRDPRNNYIAHLKIWESPDDSEKQSGAAPPQPKARYLILAVQRDTGRVTLNKAKRNANGTYSVGKDWDVNGLRAVEVMDVSIKQRLLVKQSESNTSYLGWMELIARTIFE